MGLDYSEVKSLVVKYSNLGIEYGKPLDYLLARNKISEEDIRKDLFEFNSLKFIEKQQKNGETRYALYFVYSRKRGRVYVIKFGSKLRIITIYPLGKKTLRKYRVKRFKK